MGLTMVNRSLRGIKVFFGSIGKTHRIPPSQMCHNPRMLLDDWQQEVSVLLAEGDVRTGATGHFWLQS